MNLLHSSKSRIYRLNQRRRPNYRPLQALASVLVVVAFGSLLTVYYGPSGNIEHGGRWHVSNFIPTLRNLSQLPFSPRDFNRHNSSAYNTGNDSSVIIPGTGTTGTIITPAIPLTHTNIVTTMFWAGEPADGDNGHISNVPSAWDEQWETHYGGYDDPNARNGYAPSAFTPLENPFYFALPYNDFGPQNKRQPTANGCLAYALNTNDRNSWCKNVWIAITHGSSTVYAQWEDVGPYGEDDAAYVFGTAAPKNQRDAKAGLDVSPAVRDYLKLEDVDHTTWHFVAPTEVPNGPWKTHVTTSLGSSLY